MKDFWKLWVWWLPKIRGPFWQSLKKKDHGMLESSWGPLFVEPPSGSLEKSKHWSYILPIHTGVHFFWL